MFGYIVFLCSWQFLHVCAFQGNLLFLNFIVDAVFSSCYLMVTL